MAKFKNCFSSTVGQGDEIKSFLYTSDGTAITQTGGALDVNIANANVTVDATDLDIRDLSAAQDNVAISDGTDTLAINADGSINVVASQSKPTSYAASAPVVGTSEAVIATKLSGQCRLVVRNEGSEPIYVGPTGVSVASSFKIDCGEVYEFTGDADLFAIAASATSAGDIRVFQEAA